jgi:hypothetical protein
VLNKEMTWENHLKTTWYDLKDYFAVFRGMEKQKCDSMDTYVYNYTAFIHWPHEIQFVLLFGDTDS